MGEWLTKACIRGDVEFFLQLLRSGVDIDSTAEVMDTKMTPLHAAVHAAQVGACILTAAIFMKSVGYINRVAML